MDELLAHTGWSRYTNSEYDKRLFLTVLTVYAEGYRFKTILQYTGCPKKAWLIEIVFFLTEHCIDCNLKNDITSVNFFFKPYIFKEIKKF